MTLKSPELKSGCFANAAEEEPIFVLRAKDRFAPQLVEEWAQCVERAVAGDLSEKATKSKTKARYARALAHQMRAWQALNDSKIPD